MRTAARKRLRQELIQSKYWIVNGRRMHARVAISQAPAGVIPIVLVHGMGASHRYMIPLAQELAPYFPIYVPDMPGFGLSDKPPKPFDIPQLADALAAWIDAVGLERPVLLGNSMGCQIIVDLAARSPHHLSAAVLQGPTTDPAHRSFFVQWWRLFINGRHEPKPGLGRILIRDYANCGVRGFIQTVRYTLNDKVEDKLPRVTVPTLVVVGSNDTAVPLAWAKMVAAKLPHGKLVVVENAAHAMNYCFPKELREVTQSFLHELGY